VASASGFVVPSGSGPALRQQTQLHMVAASERTSTPSRVAPAPASSLGSITANDVMTTIPNAEGNKVMKSNAFKFFNAALSVPLLHNILFGVYRSQMVTKAEGMGIQWTAYLQDLKARMSGLLSLQKKMTNPELTIPEYYYAPIHAYENGNLCWDSAMEEDLWSKLMIAPLFGGSANGDVLMRRDWLDTTARHAGEVRQAVDLGSGTGLSLNSMLDTWPESQVTGVDMSTFKLAIHQSKLNDMAAEQRDRVSLFNNAAEESKQPSDNFDLATLCLVCHESPKAVSESIFAEAFRILRPGGTFSVLDLDKENLEILLTNPFVAAIYAQTEPYMGEYLALNIKDSLVDAGFEMVEIRQSTPSHKAFIARKPVLAA
jgi:ubiquinone/menaquinone biosynthesis C-methylase UbiE